MYKEELNRLIGVGQGFNFQNNSRNSQHGKFTQVSDDFLGWIANTESFIIDNYGKESGPYKLFAKLDQTKFNGYEEDDFNEQKSIVLGVLKACKTIPVKVLNNSEHPIIELLKNKTFWTILVITLGGAFALGIHFGGAKFDKEKIDLYEENRQLTKQNTSLKDSLSKNRINNADSLFVE